MRLFFLLLNYYVYFAITDGFNSILSTRNYFLVSQKHSLLMVSSARTGAKYQELLKQAMEAKALTNRPGKSLKSQDQFTQSDTEISKETEVFEPRPWIREEVLGVDEDDSNRPLTARDLASFKNKIPFTNDIYEQILFVIETLNERKSTNAPLAVETTERLMEAVELIIIDAKKFLPPPKPSRPVNEYSDRSATTN